MTKLVMTSGGSLPADRDDTPFVDCLIYPPPSPPWTNLTFRNQTIPSPNIA